MLMKNSNDSMGKRTRDFSACSTVSQLLEGYVIDIIAYRCLMYLKRRTLGHGIDKKKEGFLVVCMQ
jgi:hypothetical protein